MARRGSAERIDVAGSSAIKAASYHPEDEELAITFTSGSMYAYTGVTREDADSFRDADSKGGHVADHIKGEYPFRLVLKEHADVDSSVIRQIDYDSATEGACVTFANGRTGRYADVPWDVISAWEKAPSKGQFFNAHIRNSYEYEAL